MITITKVLESIITAIILMGGSLALLMVMLISIIYSVGYLYDSIMGNSLYKLGMFIAKKYPVIKKFSILVKIKKILEPRKQFVRYETPMCAYCFSLTAVLLIYSLLKALSIKYDLIFAFIIYIMMYFIGMYRRYDDKECYGIVLNNNLEFLKMSFLPLTFLITVGGFCFTIAGFNLQQIDWGILASLQENGVKYVLSNEFYLLFKSSIWLLVIMYIISIPMQLVSYYIILVIKYFQNYGNGYKKIVACFLKIFKRCIW